MEAIKKYDVESMCAIIKEKYPFISSSQIYKDLKIASKQFSKDFKFGTF